MLICKVTSIFIKYKSSIPEDNGDKEKKRTIFRKLKFFKNKNASIALYFIIAVSVKIFTLNNFF